MENGMGTGAESEIEREIRFIRERFGIESAVIRGEDLALVLGYPSADALRKSAERETCPVIVSRGAGKRGLEAHIEEVAAYLASLRGRKEKAKPRADDSRGLALTARARHDRNSNGPDRMDPPSDMLRIERSEGGGE